MNYDGCDERRMDQQIIMVTIGLVVVMLRLIESVVQVNMYAYHETL
jgi:hypothetical protein